MEIPIYISELHKKLTAATQVNKNNTMPVNFSNFYLKVETMFNLIRIFLLAELDGETSGLCLRIIFFLFEEIMKEERESLFQGHNNICTRYFRDSSINISRIIIFINSLIKSPDLKKKFTNRILIKNINWVYSHQHDAKNTNKILILPGSL